MFTFKKIALLGAAGLAALSMSCSDDDGSDASGSFTTPFAVSSVSGVAQLTGVIEANEGYKIDSVVTRANGNKVTLTTSYTFPATKVTLTGANLVGVCDVVPAGGSINIVVTATFDDNSKLEGSGTVTYDCSDVTNNALVKTPITLSWAGTSYADLDATPVATYDQASAKQRLADIDLVAYNVGSGGTGTGLNKIYTPFDEPAEFFWDAEYNYLGGSVFFYPLPAEAVALISAATHEADISSFTGALADFVDTTTDVDEIDIVNNAGFLVYTTAGKYVAVIITGSAAQSVTLGTTKF